MASSIDKPRIPVATIDDLVEGVPFGVKVRGRELMLVSWGNEIFALRNICAHMAAMLTAGWIQREIVQGAQFFEVDVEENSPIVRCAWHGFRYRLRDGVCTADPNLRVRSYPVVVDGNTVLVEIDQ